MQKLEYLKARMKKRFNRNYIANSCVEERKEKRWLHLYETLVARIQSQDNLTFFPYIYIFIYI